MCGLEVRRVQVVCVPLLAIAAVGASLFHKPDGYAHSQAHAAPWNSLGRGADYVHCFADRYARQSGDIHMAQGLDWAMQNASSVKGADVARLFTSPMCQWPMVSGTPR